MSAPPARSHQCRACSRLDAETVARCILEEGHDGHHHAKVEFFFLGADSYAPAGSKPSGITADEARRKLDAYL